MTAVSGTPTDNLQPVDKPSDDHDGGDQHNHASEGSHVGDTAGQDENDIPEIALMETTSVSGVAEVIENPSDVLDFESVEDLNLETTSIGDTLCIPASKASTIDEFEAKIDVPEQPSLPDLVLAAENHDLPLSDILVDDEDVEDLHSLDSLTSDGNNKLMTPMSESSIDTLDRVPEPQESSPSAASSSASLESVSTPQDGMESTDQVDSTGAPELRSHDKLMAVPVEPSCKARSPFAVQIEEVLDEEFVRYSRSDRLEELSITIFNQDIPQPPTSPQERFASQDVDIILDPGASGGDVSDVRSEARPPPTVEEVLDEDFSADAHPNVSTANITFDYSSDTGATLPWSDPVDSSSPGSTQQTKTSKRVRFADAESAQSKSEISSTKWAPEDLRFIFFRETRDFNSYRELQESYQALFDEAEGYNAVNFSKPENTTTFITHSPYTPPATMFDLQYYRVPASYYHTFWHPQRVPIYLHGNVFDGISLTNWIYNWTAYTFKDNSYQMNAVRRLGKTVVKLGSALSDIEHAKPAVKAKLPRDLYDESGVLWADLENIINDIMSEAEDRLEASKQGGRLEVEFVSRFSHELIAGNKYYRPIEKFLKKTEAWCKKARFHPEFIMLWELWES
ncbi:hypothetical protein DL95DRAFT_382648 [Leptodontidium sp. 2 PMI_412]|nr:hypothetical protein DL95DRAFT_382648 [Leptodontidium sp. 2 PMI_412]